MIHTRDGHRLRLGRARAIALGARLESLGLAEAVRPNYRGDMAAAVTRTVAHLGRQARRVGSRRGARSGRRYTVLQAHDDGQEFHLLARALPDGSHDVVEVRALGAAADREDSDATRKAQLDLLRAILGIRPGLPLTPAAMQLARTATRAGRAQVLADGATDRSNRPDRYYVTADGRRINVELDTKPKASLAHQQRLRAKDPTSHNYFLHIHPVTGLVTRALYDPPGRKPRVIYQRTDGGPVSAVDLPRASLEPLPATRPGKRSPPKRTAARPPRARASARPGSNGRGRSRELEQEIGEAAAELEMELAAATAALGSPGGNQRLN